MQKKWHCSGHLLSDDITGAVPPTKKRKCTFEDEEEIYKDEDTKMYLKDSTLF